MPGGLRVIFIGQVAPASKELLQSFAGAYSPLSAPVIPIPPIASVAVPVFMSVTACGALVVPMLTLPKFSFEVDRLTEAASPVPVRLAVCGLPEALSLIESVAVRVPLAAGLKVTLIPQLAPAPKDEPQVFVCEKSPLFVPVIEILEILTAVLPGLENVML